MVLYIETPDEAQYVEGCANTAMDHGLFSEWLCCFIAAYQQGAKPKEAAMAGLIEWDM
jgi:hypothetical protein